MSYVVEKRKLADGGEWTRVGSTHLCRMAILHLADNVEYVFRVMAENAFGISDPGEESEAMIIQHTKMEMNYDLLG